MKRDTDMIKKVLLVENVSPGMFGFKWEADPGLNPDSAFNLFTRRSPAAVTHGFKLQTVFFLFLNYAAANANQCQCTLKILLCCVCARPELSRLPTVKAKTLKCGCK